MLGDEYPVANRDSAYQDRERARLRYKPASIGRLLIAESPPTSLDRFFYYEDVRVHDRLFIETMHAVYRFEFPEISIPIDEKDPYDRLPDTLQLRRRKGEFLERFMDDGFYLIDAVDTPMPTDSTPAYKKCMIDGAVTNLIEKIRSLRTVDTEIILISPRVYRVRKKLEESGLAVENTCVIDFPLSSGRRPFLKKMTALLKPYFDEKGIQTIEDE